MASETRILDIRALRNALETAALEQEFNSLPLCAASTSDVPAAARHKNRYANVLPNPETRVLLSKVDNDEASTYINANFVSGFNGSPRTFIATQGPLPTTCDDFWRMIWEQESCVVVMVTHVTEGGRPKCHQYWPDTVGQKMQFQHFTVENADVSKRSDFTVTTIQLTHIGTRETRTITHCWYTAWPDHGVPSDTSGVLECLHFVRKIMRNKTVPIVIHCSAGIGRTGAFMASYICMLEIHNEWRVVDIRGTLNRMRKERGGTIQTFVQYHFVHRVLVDYTTMEHPHSMHLGEQARQVTLERKNEEDFYGFTVRGSCPAFILTVDPDGLAAKHGVRVRDSILAVNGKDTTHMLHADVVKQILAAGDSLTLTLISVTEF